MNIINFLFLIKGLNETHKRHLPGKYSLTLVHHENSGVVFFTKFILGIEFTVLYYEPSGWNGNNIWN